MMRIPATAKGFWLFALLCNATLASLAAQQAPAAKQFPPGALRRLEDLPASRLRSRIERLPGAARDSAVAWLGNFHFTEHDLPFLQVDPAGGIYYADEFALGEPPADPAEEFLSAGAGVPVSPFPASLVFHSKPGAPNILFLNFSGETVSGTAWNTEIGRTSIPAVAFSTDSDFGTFSDAEQTAIRRIWQRVAEDYAPFNIDVTTERPATFSSRTAHALITRNTDANGAANPASTSGGVAYVGVFANSSYAKYRPAWIYYNNLGGEESFIAEAVSHEAGHNFGLSHDGKTDGGDYYGGHGSGETSWGPLMGTGYNRNVSQWSKGEYYLANNTQDDLATIAAKLTYRTDDHGNSFASASPLTISATGVISSTDPESDPANDTPVNKGVLERNTDLDLFSFAAGSGPLSLSVKPWVVGSALTRGGNADLLLELYDSSGQLILTNNPASSTAGTLVANVVEGLYYLGVRGTGTGNPNSSSPSGFTAYGSIGQYFISGTVVASGLILPPTAELLVTDITEPGQGAKRFTVTYSDNAGVNVASIGSDDISVVGPNGYSETATLVAIDFPSNGTPRKATYEITPPSTTWTEADGGTYSVSILPDTVSDTEGASVAARQLGTFKVAVPRSIYFEAMNSDPGWTLEGLWQFGVPKYNSGGPESGFTGSTILAYNLSGNYENRLAPVYAITPPIDCSGSSSVTLRFRRWLRLRNSDTAVLQVSTDGRTWTDLWRTSRSVNDNSWQEVQYSLPDWAARSSTVQLRWGLSSGNSQNELGWNIDDVTLLANGVLDTVAPTAAINVANLTAGGSAAHTFTVTYSDDTAIKIDSLGSADLLVLGPGGYSNLVEFAGVDTPADGTPRTALYSAPAPAGLWDSSANGEYQIFLQPGEVTDTANNPVEETLLATFTVAISESRQALVVAPLTLNIVEGGSAAFTVRLAEQPSSEVVVVSQHSSGDPDLVITSGATNLFTPENWSVAQPVSLAALADSDGQYSSATLECRSEGLPSAVVVATIQPNTAPPPSIRSIARQSGYVEISVSGPDGVPLSLEASRDSTHWELIRTSEAEAGSVTFTEPLGDGFRFYRVVIR